MVVAPRLVRACRREPPARVHELLLDAGELQPVGLLRVQPQEARLHLGQQLEVGGQRILELLRGTGDPQRAGQVAPEQVHDRDRVPQAVLVLEVEHLREALRPHVRIAVAVAADPAPERERALLRLGLEAELAQLVGEQLQHVGHGVGVEPVEVPDRVARLVHHVRARDPQLVRLPEQVDRLLEPLGRARPPALEQLRDLAQLVEHGAARGLGGMGGEHGPHAQAPHLARQLLARDPRPGYPGSGLGEPPAVAVAHACQLAPAVHLLGDVREVEVGGERPHQAGRGQRLDLAQYLRSRGPVRPDQPADALHELEERLSLLAHERPAEHRAERADVAAQVGVALSPGLTDSCARRHTRRGRRGRRGPR